MNKNKNFTVLSMVTDFLKGSKRYFVLSVALALLVSGTELVNPQIIGFAVDYIIGKITPQGVLAGTAASLLQGFSTGKMLLFCSLAILFVSLLSVVFRYFFRLADSVGAETLVLNIRTKLFSHIERLPYGWQTENRTGDIIQRCTSDVDMVKNFLSEQLTSMFRIVVMIVLSLVFMFSMNVTLSLVALVTIPVIIAYSAVFHVKISKGFERCDEAEGVLSAITQENLTGVRVVRAFGRESYERERFAKQSGLYADLWLRLDKLFSLFWGTGDLVSGLQVMLIIIIGSVLCVKGQMSAGQFIAFISYNSMLVWPVRQLGRMISEMSKVSVSLDRIFFIMNSPEEADKPHTKKGNMSGDIRFENVSFSYTDGTKVLDGVSFEIKHGTTFGILGTTGSGKSTLMYLLDRLYDLPQGSGRISVGGVDIADMKASEVRTNIGLVMQEPFLFSRTIGENIAMARESISEDEIRDAAQTACLSETIDAFPKGFDTMVGERGVTLSGGQKQRTAIAEMLTRKTPIMIFDDSLSALDSDTDAKIRHALKEKTGNATFIIISHRTSTLMHADKILVLDNGKVLQCGSHEELCKKDGLYKKIYDIQNAIKEAQ